MFPTSDKPLLSIPDPDEDLDLDDEDEEEDVERHLDVPPSWCEQIAITYKGTVNFKAWKCFKQYLFIAEIVSEL